MERELPRQSIEGDRHTFRNSRHEIDVYKLIDLTSDIPATSVEVENLGAVLDESNWSDSEGQPLRPREVIAAIRAAGSIDAAIGQYPTMAEHIRKIDQADPSRAILVQGSEILDGVHRLAKVILGGGKEIPVKVLTEIPPAAITQEFPLQDSE